jgi:hypothetical protein
MTEIIFVKLYLTFNSTIKLKFLQMYQKKKTKNDYRIVKINPNTCKKKKTKNVPKKKTNTALIISKLSTKNLLYVKEIRIFFIK